MSNIGNKVIIKKSIEIILSNKTYQWMPKWTARIKRYQMFACLKRLPTLRVCLNQKKKGKLPLPWKGWTGTTLYIKSAVIRAPPPIRTEGHLCGYYSRQTCVASTES